MSSFDEAIQAVKDLFGREISIPTNDNKAKEKAAGAAKPAVVTPKSVPAKKAAQKVVPATKRQEANAAKTGTKNASGLF